MSTLYAFVTGPSGAGKTTFLQSLGDLGGFWIDNDQGIECRQITVDDSLDVLLFCSTDAQRFDQLMEISERDMLGYILLVDSATPDTWEQAQYMFNNCHGYALLPMVIGANKQDKSGAASADAVMESVGSNAMTSAEGLVATNSESAASLFLQLLYNVNREIERLDSLIAELEKFTEKDN
jgi:signal recognition particle receptor subunit beta